MAKSKQPDRLATMATNMEEASVAGRSEGWDEAIRFVEALFDDTIESIVADMKDEKERRALG